MAAATAANGTSGTKRPSFHDDYEQKTNLAGIKFKRILMDSAENKMTFVQAEERKDLGNQFYGFFFLLILLKGN